jgi:hypothetical protein
LFSYFITAVNICIPIYLLDYMSYGSYIFLFAVEETHFCGAEGVTTSIYIIRRAAMILQVNLNSYIVGDNYCRQKLVKGVR